MKLTVREISIFGFLAAIMYASKLAMEFLPNIHLVGVFVIAFTDVYRKKALYPIYIFVFITGLFSGFSAWWVPYIYIWTVLWGMAMLVPSATSQRRKIIVYMILCAAHGFLYGLLYAPAQMFLFGLSFKGMLAWIVAGLGWDVVHGVGNFFCGALIYPVIKALKFGEKYSGM